MDVLTAEVVLRGDAGHVLGNALVAIGVGDSRGFGADRGNRAQPHRHQPLGLRRGSQLAPKGAQLIQPVLGTLADPGGELDLACQPFLLDLPFKPMRSQPEQFTARNGGQTGFPIEQEELLLHTKGVQRVLPSFLPRTPLASTAGGGQCLSVILVRH